jgi:hypothetical protein
MMGMTATATASAITLWGIRQKLQSQLLSTKRMVKMKLTPSKALRGEVR